MPEPMSPFSALALQITCESVNKCGTAEEARTKISKALERVARQVAASKVFVGPSLRLVVLPEYFLTSYPQGGSIET